MKRTLLLIIYNQQASANVFASMPLYYGGVINNQIDKQKLMVSMQESVAKMTETEIKQTITTSIFYSRKIIQTN